MSSGGSSRVHSRADLDPVGDRDSRAVHVFICKDAILNAIVRKDRRIRTQDVLQKFVHDNSKLWNYELRRSHRRQTMEHQDHAYPSQTSSTALPATFSVPACTSPRRRRKTKLALFLESLETAPTEPITTRSPQHVAPKSSYAVPRHRIHCHMASKSNDHVTTCAYLTTARD